MHTLYQGLQTVRAHTGSLRTYIVSFISIVLGYFALANGKSALGYFSYSSLSFFTKLKLFFISFFDMGQFTETSILALVLLVALFGAETITLMSVYGSIRKEAVTKSGLYSGIAFVFAVLGVGCAACGAVLLSTLLSFVGLSSLLVYFPYHGVEVGYVGVVLLVYVSYTLLKRLANPYTC
jgi:hypothetical protein